MQRHHVPLQAANGQPLGAEYEQSVRRLRDVIWACGRTSTCVSVCPQHTLSLPKQPWQPTATESPERLVGGLLNSSRIVLVWRCTRVARSTPDKRRQGETTGSDDELRREAPPALLAAELPCQALASQQRPCSLPGCPCPGKLQRRPAVISKVRFCWELSSRIAVYRDRILGRGVGSNSWNRSRRV